MEPQFRVFMVIACDCITIIQHKCVNLIKISFHSTADFVQIPSLPEVC